jgi:MoxR-like ATPase
MQVSSTPKVVKVNTTKAAKSVIKPNSMQQRVTKLLAQLGEGMHEREQVLAIALLGAIAGHNTFLYGPPGTAKSLISRRLAAAFDQPNYFEYLMNRFSTPEEVFGPVSLKALKEDRYIRQIDGYLPTADFAFLDEIWKSSPAILNSLLTIINEHLFKNGPERVAVPLKSLVAASNEVPAENQGLDALFDRFIIRLVVPPITQEDNFTRLLNTKPRSDKQVIEPSLLIHYDELSKWREKLHEVTLSDDTLLIIRYIRLKLAERFDELKVYVSDRRWQRAAMLLKASAFCNDRATTNHSDALLLKHCLWTTPENQPLVSELVHDAVKACGVATDVDLAQLDTEKDTLDKEINRELFHSEDVYDTAVLKDGKTYFKVKAVFKDKYRPDYFPVFKEELYILIEEFKGTRKFNPLDASGNEISNITGQFNGQGSCMLVHYMNDRESHVFTPKVMFKKGDKKKDINERLVKSLAGSVENLRHSLKRTLTQVQAKYDVLTTELASPFVKFAETDIALAAVVSQIDQIKLRIVDCERLESLCR